MQRIQYQTVRTFAGHSHWHNIRYRKAAVDSRRHREIERLLREVSVAARLCRTDQAHYPRLQHALSVARKANVPDAKIARTLQRAQQRGAEGENSLVFDAVLSGGVGVLVNAENNAQAKQEVRALISRHGDPNGAAWMFRKEFRIVATADDIGAKAESIVDCVIDAGAEDVTVEQQSIYVMCENRDDCETVVKSLRKLGYQTDVVNELVPAQWVQLENGSQQHENFVDLLHKLNSHPLVVSVQHNAKIVAT